MRARAGFALTVTWLAGCNFSIDPAAFSPTEPSDAVVRRSDAAVGSDAGGPDALVALDAEGPDTPDPSDHDGEVVDGGADAALPYFDGGPDDLPGWCFEHCWASDPFDAGCDWAVLPCLGVIVCVDREPCEPCLSCQFPEPSSGSDDPEAGAGQ